MADPVLHIKDAYFFEVPKVLWPRNFKSRDDVARVSPVWVELDDQFQDWEFHRQYNSLTKDLAVTLPPADQAHEDWHHWTHEDHVHFGKPFDEFLKFKYDQKNAGFEAWKKQQVENASQVPAEQRTEAVRDAKKLDFHDYKVSGVHHLEDYDGFIEKLALEPPFAGKWEAAKMAATDVKAYVADKEEAEWSAEKLAGYSNHLAGKVLIPQPFGRLRNLHEAESGITITKYMLVEVGVALVLAILFSWLARRVIHGGAPKGRLWNLLETFVVFIRTQIAEPAMGGGHDDAHAPAAHGHVEHGHHVDAQGHATVHAAHAHDTHAQVPKKSHAKPPMTPARRFTPLLCSIFFFVLGCNLAGMLPWIGSPTAVFGVTLAMALVTLCTVFAAGMLQFGFFGFFANQVPTMDMPWYMAMVMKPVIFVIEFGGLLIKHGVLAVRLLANMLAGHMVLLAIMGLAFGSTAAAQFVQADGSVSVTWWITAVIAVFGCAVLSILELFVAFLQAFVFTMLSALFIGAAIHKH